MSSIKVNRPGQRFWMLLLYIVSTGYFIYQHSTGMSWDFSVYVLNAKYLLGQGDYFEWLRPPLVSVILAVYSVFGWLVAEYLFIISVSALFMFSAWKLAGSCEMPAAALYGLLITPFVLNYGFLAGPELLYFALVILFVAYIGKEMAGPVLSLLFLTRYNGITYLPLILFTGKPKKILVAVLLMILVVVPWLAYNYVSTGDALTSIADAYAMNIKFRYEYMDVAGITVHEIISVIGLYLPLALLGVYVTAGKRKFNRMDCIMATVAILTLISYARIPVKDPRYLIALILPAAYFSLRFINRYNAWDRIIPLIVMLNFSLAALFFIPLVDTTEVEDSIPALDGCGLQSNRWPYFNYFGVPCEPYPPKNKLLSEIEAGKRIMLFKNETEPEYLHDREFIDSLPLLKETREYVFIGDAGRCAKTLELDKTYLERLHEKGVNITPIEVFLP